MNNYCHNTSHYQPAMNTWTYPAGSIVPGQWVPFNQTWPPISENFSACNNYSNYNCLSKAWKIGTNITPDNSLGPNTFILPKKEKYTHPNSTPYEAYTSNSPPT